eukprot:TRINITY_DN11349_c0_g1_i2.p1 TRINITY_DN11349_c0_g1~~TRINITY_DN11349_c0_g1_i2.p1  ORF type:complete len:835 (-),score=107.60 TRINITY_DN11349_c0_g1_i2:1168-3591(-)
MVESKHLILGSIAVGACATTLWIMRCQQLTVSLSKRPYFRLALTRDNFLYPYFFSTQPLKRQVRYGAQTGGLQLDPQFYPQARRDSVNGEYELCGDTIKDPYLWLEDPDSEETKKFVQEQNQVTQSILEQCESRSKFSNLMTKLYNFPRYGCPFKRGNRYYFYYNQGLQAQDVLFSQSNLTEQPFVVIDPNKLSEDGTVSMSGTSFSDNGEIMAYQLSTGGSDWKNVKLLQIAANGGVKHLEEELKYVKFSDIEWTKDNKGFFYQRYEAPQTEANGELGTETQSNTCQQVWYHCIGQKQENDAKLWVDEEHPNWMTSFEVTDDGRYLIAYVSEGCRPANLLWYLDMNALQQNDSNTVDWSAYDLRNQNPKRLPFEKIINEFEATFQYEANDGEIFYLRTNKDAPRYRLVQTDLKSKKFVDVIKQHDRDLLKWVCALKGDFAVTCYLSDVVDQLELRKLSTGELIKQFEMPYIGSVTGFSGNRKSNEFFFKFQGFTDPGQIYRVNADDLPDLKLNLLRLTKLEGYDSSQLETKQVFVKSYDGTKIPMFIIYKKGTIFDGTNPTMLYGYGGFNISLNPSFSVSRLCFILGYNGVYAIANLRGGGEYGTDWRDAGSVLNKQNVFDDFHSCAEFLVDNKYCSSKTLTIKGGSNGGLLVGACINQRPDLYACGLAQVPVMDMLRFHKFTIGHAWMTDFGNPDVKQDYEYLKTYSPLHNISIPVQEPRQYPAVCVTTADHDDRVVPLHSFKFMAELHHTVTTDPSSQQRNPLILRVDVKAGHGAGKPTAKVIEEEADTAGFAAKCMNVQWQYD